MGSRKYTIVLPVHNGGSYVRACMASVLAQTVSDFDLVVLENRSTDGTAEWLATLDDPRVTVLPAERPLTIEENWGRILVIPKGTYLTTIGHDDLLDADFLATIDALIEENPQASLFQTHFRLIDENGAFLRPCRPIPFRESGAEFLAARLRARRDSFGTGYIMRSTDYEQVGGIPPYRGLLFADDALFMQLSLRSWKATDPHERFSYRSHRQSASSGAVPTDIVSAARHYVDFLTRLRGQHEPIDAVLQQHGRTFFQRLLRVCYREEFLRRAAIGEEVPLSFISQLNEISERIAPGSKVGPRLPLPYRLLQWLPSGKLRQRGSSLTRSLRKSARTVYRGILNRAGIYC
jgi:glycosyltransferase involved in cell wall biosynthesis